MTCNGYSHKGAKRQRRTRSTRRAKLRLDSGNDVNDDAPAFGNEQHSYENMHFTEISNRWIGRRKW